MVDLRSKSFPYCLAALRLQDYDSLIPCQRIFILSGLGLETKVREYDGGRRCNVSFNGTELSRNGVCSFIAEEGMDVILLVHNAEEEQQLTELIGKLSVYRLYPSDSADKTPVAIDCAVKHAFVFERNLPECCQDIQLCHSWCPQRLYVVTSSLNPVQLVYRGLGASYVIHSRSGDISFVL